MSMAIQGYVQRCRYVFTSDRYHPVEDFLIFFFLFPFNFFLFFVISFESSQMQFVK